ncbi:MAG TPA: magnesium transporter CorA family protein [Thermoanaerobaculia bacterium]|nr:magnesium transporter CorA family protein [Thermoanaerobaculia bacterium]
MALLREVDPGEIGLAGRVKPADRRPPRTVLFHPTEGRRDAVPLKGIAARLASGGFFYADLHAPDEDELETLRQEFHFHPLAIEDVRSRHQRPKIDVYTNQYFLVFYRIGPGGGEGEWLLQEIDFFIGPNFLVVTHDSEVALLDTVFERFCREEGQKDVSTILYDILDAMVDDYFLYLDDLGERSQAIDERIFETFDPKSLEEILDLKRDLALLRRVVAPARDAINVLLRRDPPVIDTARIFYFQDIYDHLIRITDSIDTYRELATGSLDAFLSIQNNRLADVVRKLTVISVIFLPITAATGFFGMNFHIFEPQPRNDYLFLTSLALIVGVPVVMLLFLRRKVLR